MTWLDGLVTQIPAIISAVAAVAAAYASGRSARPEFFKVFEASGCQAATGSAAVGWLIQAWVGSARIFGSAVVEKRSG